MKYRVLYFSFGFLFVFFSFFQLIRLEVVIEYDIVVDTTLKASDSPYVIPHNLKVYDGVTLTVEEGTVIELCYYCYFKIEGSLVAIGTKEKNIIFTGVEGRPGFYREIEIYGSNHQIEHVTFLNGHTLHIHSSNDEDTLTFQSCTISNMSDYAISVGQNININIDSSLIIDNAFGVAVSTRDVNFTITNTHFISNEGGALAFGSNAYFMVSKCVFKNNIKSVIHFASVSKDSSVTDCVFTNNGYHQYYSVLYFENPGLKEYEQKIIIDNNRFEENTGSLVYLRQRYQKVEMKNNIFRNNHHLSEATKPMFYGGNYLRSEFRFRNNKVYSNNGTRSVFELNLNGYFPEEQLYVFHDNVFVNPMFDHEIEVLGHMAVESRNMTVDATNNWWGYASKEQILERILGHEKDEERPIILIDPFLASSEIQNNCDFCFFPRKSCGYNQTSKGFEMFECVESHQKHPDDPHKKGKGDGDKEKKENTTDTAQIIFNVLLSVLLPLLCFVCCTFCSCCICLCFGVNGVVMYNVMFRKRSIPFQAMNEELDGEEGFTVDDEFLVDDDNFLEIDDEKDEGVIN